MKRAIFIVGAIATVLFLAAKMNAKHTAAQPTSTTETSAVETPTTNIQLEAPKVAVENAPYIKTAETAEELAAEISRLEQETSPALDRLRAGRLLPAERPALLATLDRLTNLREREINLRLAAIEKKLKGRRQ